MNISLRLTIFKNENSDLFFHFMPSIVVGYNGKYKKFYLFLAWLIFEIVIS